MPVLIAFGLAITVSAIVILVVVRTAPRLDPADVQVQDVEAARHTGPVRRFLRRRVDPEAATGLLLSVALAITSSAILAVGALLEMAQRNEGFARWDQAAAEFGARHSTDRVETMFRWVTNLGATWFAAAALAAVAFVAHRRTPIRAVPLFAATVLMSETAANNLVKLLVHRARPDIARLVGASGSSFPSGHTACAAATWAAIALLLGRGRSRRVRAALAAGAGAITTAVAASRVLLGVHWLTDVMAGAALGWGVFALCSIAFGGRLLRFGEPVARAEREAGRPAAPDMREVSR